MGQNILSVLFFFSRRTQSGRGCTETGHVYFLLFLCK